MSSIRPVIGTPKSTEVSHKDIRDVDFYPNEFRAGNWVSGLFPSHAPHYIRHYYVSLIKSLKFRPPWPRGGSSKALTCQKLFVWPDSHPGSMVILLKVYISTREGTSLIEQWNIYTIYYTCVHIHILQFSDLKPTREWGKMENNCFPIVMTNELSEITLC